MVDYGEDWVVVGVEFEYCFYCVCVGGVVGECVDGVVCG